jgi:hypothetical protein
LEVEADNRRAKGKWEWNVKARNAEVEGESKKWESGWDVGSESWSGKTSGSVL